MNYQIFFTFPLNRATILVIALVLDFIFGDPQIRFHPIIAVGKLIKCLERVLLKNNYSQARKKINGIILVIITLIVTSVLTYFILFYSFKII